MSSDLPKKGCIKKKTINDINDITYYRLYNEKDKIIELYNQNVSRRQIAKKYSCTPRQLNTFLRENGIFLRNNSYNIDLQNSIDYIVKQFNEGKKIIQLAKEFNVSRATIRLLLRENNAPIRLNQKRISINKINNIIQDYQDGMNRAQLAYKYGLSEGYITELLQKEHVNINNYNQNAKNKMIRKSLESLKDEIIYRYTFDKVSLRQLEKDYGWSRRIITKFLKDNNIKIRSYNHKSNDFWLKKAERISNQYGEQIKKDFNNGMSLRKISLKYKIGRRIITNFLKDNDFKIVSVSKADLNLHREQIINEYKNGYTLSDLTQKYHCKIYILRNFLINNNIQLREDRPRRKDVWKFSKDIVEQYLANKTLAEIAKQYNCSSNVIKAICYKEGVYKKREQPFMYD